MNKQELTARIDDSLPAGQSLTKEKVENRAINIQETDSYILFDIERHPGANNPRHGQPDITIQTWRYDKEASTLELIWKFAKSYRDTLEQNNVGEPVCRHCGTRIWTHTRTFPGSSGGALTAAQLAGKKKRYSTRHGLTP